MTCVCVCVCVRVCVAVWLCGCVAVIATGFVCAQVFLERRQREVDNDPSDLMCYYRIVYEYRLPRHHINHTCNSMEDMKQAPMYYGPAAMNFIDQVPQTGSLEAVVVGSE